LVDGRSRKYAIISGMRKIIFALLAVLFLVGCTQKPVTGVQVPTPRPTILGVKEIFIDSFSYGFTPNTIELTKGEKVVLYINNKGGFHSFSIPSSNIEVQTPSGETTAVEYTAEKEGTFEFKCTIGNHAAQGQKGTIIVK
jgi:heme/copper-type cytochrome/quinol oxidase subunit 2